MKLPKTRSIVLGFLLLFLAVGIAQPVSAITVSVENGAAVPGGSDTVSIVIGDINATDDTGITAATIWLYFDNQSVNVSGVAAGDLGDVTSVPPPSTKSPFKMTAVKAFSVTGDSLVFADVTLGAIGSPGESTLGLYVKTLNNDTNKPLLWNTTVSNGTFTVTGEAPEVHDISVTTDYSGAVNGIKITRDGTDVVGEGEDLIIGETYNISYKLVNEGDFDETGIAVTVKIDDDILATHTYSLVAGDSNTYSDSWDTTGLTTGDYTITVNASIAVDNDPSDNERTRDVTLVTPYYEVHLTVDDETKTTTPNVNAIYTLTVENIGTLADNYTLTVDNPDGADVAALDTYTITNLKSDTTQGVVLNVADATIGTYRVNVTVVSDNDQTNATYYVNTTTTVEKKVVHRGGRGTPRDTDNDGYTDIQEMLADTDENDPCDPNAECAACIALKPAATPTPTPTPTAKPTTTPVPTPTPTAEPAAEPTPTEEPGFEAVFAIAGLLAVAYLVLRRKK